jgi:rhodanese-related sulfurtransferase
MNKIEELLKSGDTIIVDVRTPEEFMGGHVAGSINIPINEIPMRLDEFKGMKQIVLCCASGARSQNATFYLQQNGIECYNGGPWVEVNYYSNNNN